MAESWPRAVIFDLDGTLVDTVGDIADVLNEVLARAGLSTFADSEVRTMVGGGARRLFERALARLDILPNAGLPDQFAEDFAERYARLGAKRSVVYPGVRALLEVLSRTGMRLGICTNKPAEATASVLDALDLTSFFGAVVGESRGLPRKPHPAMLRAALETLGVAPHDAVMVGDSVIDVATARAAGVPIVLVSYGYSSEPPHELGADAVIDDPGSLQALLPRLGRAGTGRARRNEKC